MFRAVAFACFVADVSSIAFLKSRSRAFRLRRTRAKALGSVTSARASAIASPRCRIRARSVGLAIESTRALMNLAVPRAAPSSSRFDRRLLRAAAGVARARVGGRVDRAVVAGGAGAGGRAARLGSVSFDPADVEVVAACGSGRNAADDVALSVAADPGRPFEMLDEVRVGGGDEVDADPAERRGGVELRDAGDPPVRGRSNGGVSLRLHEVSGCCPPAFETGRAALVVVVAPACGRVVGRRDREAARVAAARPLVGPAASSRPSGRLDLAGGELLVPVRLILDRRAVGGTPDAVFTARRIGRVAGVEVRVAPELLAGQIFQQLCREHDRDDDVHLPEQQQPLPQQSRGGGGAEQPGRCVAGDTDDPPERDREQLRRLPPLAEESEQVLAVVAHPAGDRPQRVPDPVGQRLRPLLEPPLVLGVLQPVVHRAHRVPHRRQERRTDPGGGVLEERLEGALRVRRRVARAAKIPLRVGGVLEDDPVDRRGLPGGGQVVLALHQTGVQGLLPDARLVEEDPEPAERLRLAGKPGPQRLEGLLGARVVEARHVGGQVDELHRHLRRLVAGEPHRHEHVPERPGELQGGALADPDRRRCGLRPGDHLCLEPAEHDPGLVDLLLEIGCRLHRQRERGDRGGLERDQAQRRQTQRAPHRRAEQADPLRVPVGLVADALDCRSRLGGGAARARRDAVEAQRDPSQGSGRPYTRANELRRFAKTFARSDA